MSELIQKNDNRATMRWKLLTGVSALALTAYVSSANLARAEDADRPAIWIELGGQLQSLSNAQEKYSPAFMDSITQANLLTALDVQKSAPFAIAEDGKISFQPNGSDWIFSASIQYGRSQASHGRHQQTKNAPVPFHFVGIQGSKYNSFYPSSHVKFADGRSHQSERHTVLDFQAGKDVGLGMFGNEATSVVSAGVRFAQFTSKSQINLRAEPDVNYQPAAPITSQLAYIEFKYRAPPFATAPLTFHDLAGNLKVERSFHGVGPSLSWNASAPVAGNSANAELSFDWGLNAALLFGRQTVRGQHQTTVKTYAKIQWQNYGGPGYGQRGHFTPTAPAAVKSNVAPVHRTRSVTVPNLGGFAGISLKWTNAKISLGYRADMFFGAVDGGIDTRKSENRGFYGPFASISVGIGD